MILGPGGSRGTARRKVAAAKRTALVALLPVLVGLPVAIVGGRTAAAAPVPALVRAPRAWSRGVLQPGRPYSQPLQRRPGVRASAFQPAGATSTNWSGYFESGNFTSVSASWTVPAVQAASDLESAGTWIGIDGVQANTLIQTGTGENTAGGVVEYDAWYELLPQQSITIGGVAPGDSMQASIVESAPNSGSWTLSIEDLTSGQQFSTHLVYTTPGMSAEWIQEAPSDGQGNILTLADYGAVTFTALKANGSAPFAANMQPVSMVNAATGNTISRPGSLRLIDWKVFRPMMSGLPIVMRRKRFKSLGRFQESRLSLPMMPFSATATTMTRGSVTQPRPSRRPWRAAHRASAPHP